VIDGVSHWSKRRKANSIIYAGFQEVGPDNRCEEAGEQTMVKNAGEPVERSAKCVKKASISLLPISLGWRLS